MRKGNYVACVRKKLPHMDRMWLGTTAEQVVLLLKLYHNIRQIKPMDDLVVGLICT